MTPSNPEILLDFLRNHQNVEFIKHYFVDPLGLLRVLHFPVSQTLKMATRNQPMKLGCSSMLNIHSREAEKPWYRTTGSNLHYPDWSTLRILDPEGRHAFVLSYFSIEKTLHPGIDYSKPFQWCPRNALRQANAFAEHSSLKMLTGFELEFALIHKMGTKDESIAYASKTNSGTSWAAASIRGDLDKCMETIVIALQKGGIEVEAYHGEGSLHRFEISLAPLPLLESVDALVYTQEVIKQTADRLDYWAIYYVKPFKNESTNGLHVHLSIDDCSIQVEESFLAGMMHRLPLLTAFSMCAPDSHLRAYMTSDLVSWGTENRNTAIRKIKSRHWEIRTLDYMNNPYLATAAYVAAGVVGVLGKEPLRWKDCVAQPQHLDEQRLEELGITTRIPRMLGGKLEILGEGFMGLEKVLGVEVLEFYRNFKIAHQEVLKGMGKEEIWAFYTHHF